jgi:hypothetical protein
MLARKQCPDISNYASNRVFDGTRPLSADRVARLRANYNRTHTMTVFRFVVARVTRLFGFGRAHTSR